MLRVRRVAVWAVRMELNSALRMLGTVSLMKEVME